MPMPIFGTHKHDDGASNKHHNTLHKDDGLGNADHAGHGAGHGGAPLNAGGAPGMTNSGKDVYPTSAPGLGQQQQGGMSGLGQQQGGMDGLGQQQQGGMGGVGHHQQGGMGGLGQHHNAGIGATNQPGNTYNTGNQYDSAGMPPYGEGMGGAGAGTHGAGPMGTHGNVGGMQGNAGVGAPGMHGNAGVGAGHGIPPTAGVNAGGQQHGGSGHSMTGKIERTVGTLLGSAALKEKGMMKEQEASSHKVQAAELGEAERLEREALMRRERAVAHGAHPDNKHLGAGGGAMPGQFQ